MVWNIDTARVLCIWKKLGNGGRKAKIVKSYCHDGMITANYKKELEMRL